MNTLRIGTKTTIRVLINVFSFLDVFEEACEIGGVATNDTRIGFLFSIYGKVVTREYAQTELYPISYYLKNFSMSFVTGIQNKAINYLIQSCGNAYDRFEWIPYSKITDIESSQIDNVYYAIHKDNHYNVKVMLLCLGNSEECTPTLARVYSLPTHKYKNDDNNFRRYSYWLYYRNKPIRVFTENDDRYYMVAHRRFYDFYSLYGFCSACGILRCSPVWCICGHKQLSNGWATR